MNGKGLTSVLGRFSRDTRGDVAILFGLMALALFMMIGLAVDYGRFLSARNQTLAATDAAVLAGARALQTNGGDQQAALALAKTYYVQATQSRISVNNDGIGVRFGDNATSVMATGNASISTPFMGLGGTKSLPLLHADGTDYSKAVLAVGGNAETNLEISMMLDVSGSMGEGTKLQRHEGCRERPRRHRRLGRSEQVIRRASRSYRSRATCCRLPAFSRRATGQNTTPLPSPSSIRSLQAAARSRRRRTTSYPATVMRRRKAGPETIHEYCTRHQPLRPSRLYFERQLQHQLQRHAATDDER